MTDRADRPAPLWLSHQQLTQPELLVGFEAWLQLGLLSEEQVKAFCEAHLSCELPAALINVVNTDDDFVPLTEAPHPPTPSLPALPVRAPSLMTRSLQAFMAEISVVWLLFLGVFLVVVSSGVLAASQWENVPPAGQYSILFVYTLAFWGVGRWAARRETLQLTARMLLIATLLIIPVNFWMIDGLHLWHSAAGVTTAAIAALILTAITVSLLQPGSILIESGNTRLTLLNSVGLSWLHWGWGWAGLPVIATYVGTIGTALLVFLQYRTPAPPQPPHGLAPDSASVEARLSRPFAAVVVAFATLLLVGRAVLAAQVPFSQLGLALGVCGWLLCWLTRDRGPQIWSRVGTGLLLVGWAVAVETTPPWQASAISGLGLWLLIDRLRQSYNTAALLALLLVGLQAYCLLWRVLPPAFQQNILAAAIDWAGPAGLPEALLGLAGFPYLWLVLGLAQWLRRRSTAPSGPRPEQAERLSQQAEAMALVLGVALTTMSLLNPTVRSFNLALSALTLAIVLWRRVPSAFLVYLTHTVGLAAIGSWIAWQLPGLELFAWVRILLIGTAIEWAGSVLIRDRLWQRSAWHGGLGLAGLSYPLLLITLDPVSTEYHRLLWLVVPAMLAGLGKARRFFDRPLAAGLSTGTLLAQLLLLATLENWLMALAIGTGLMLVNTHTLQHRGTAARAAAALTIGFALGCETAAIRRAFADQLTPEIVIALVAVNLWLLWGAWYAVTRRDTPLRRLYAWASNGWAIGLCILTLLVLTSYSTAVYTFSGSTSTQELLLAAALTTGAIALHLRQQPSDLGFYGVAWAAETLVCLLIYMVNGDVEDVAIANLGLGLCTQIAGDGRARWLRLTYRPSWHVIPLLYAGLGAVLAHSTFTGSTGLHTLAAALVGIGIGRRNPRFKPLTLVTVFLASAAAYELLIYQLMQATGGAAGDGMALLAGLAIAIAWIDDRLSRCLCFYLRLSRDQIAQIAHLHWGLGSGLALLTLMLPLSATGTIVWLIVTVGLSAYALMMGKTVRQSSLDQQAAWTYAGISQGLLALGYALDRILPESVALSWAASIASVVAVALYALPWVRWGWLPQPGRHCATLLPGIVVVMTVEPIALQSLLLTAACYAWLATVERQIRLSYLSIALLDWAVLRFLDQHQALTLLGLAIVLGGSLLYVAQVDPLLQPASAREQRHWLRSLAIGLICLTALYQAEVETGATAFWIGALPLGLGLGLVFLGLVLRVRAFLYIGTAAFVVRVLRLLWLFIASYSLLLWAVGIVLGLLLIWVAATFEARRSQVNALLQYWLTELESWE